jgi:hypothetical protein
MATRVITLTDRQPVKIVEADWPLIASAKDAWCDNEYDFQAFRKTVWFLGVRQHADGRAIVYATYSHTSAYAADRGYAIKRGVLLENPDHECEPLLEALKDVCQAMAEAEHNEGDEDRWKELYHECVADFPAQTI